MQVCTQNTRMHPTQMYENFSTLATNRTKMFKFCPIPVVDWNAIETKSFEIGHMGGCANVCNMARDACDAFVFIGRECKMGDSNGNLKGKSEEGDMVEAWLGENVSSEFKLDKKGIVGTCDSKGSYHGNKLVPILSLTPVCTQVYYSYMCI